MLGGGLGATQFGPLLTDRGVTFRLWAPAAREVDLVLERRIPMRQDGEWFVLEVPQAGTGTRYRLESTTRSKFPIPLAFPARGCPRAERGDRSHLSLAVGDWKGRPWSDAVFLEAHVGTFTPEGTFRAMMERLDHLAATGITAIELMPSPIFRAAELGLRRRAAICTDSQLRPA